MSISVRQFVAVAAVVSLGLVSCGGDEQTEQSDDVIPTVDDSDSTTESPGSDETETSDESSDPSETTDEEPLISLPSGCEVETPILEVPTGGVMSSSASYLVFGMDIEALLTAMLNSLPNDGYTVILQDDFDDLKKLQGESTTMAGHTVDVTLSPANVGDADAGLRVAVNKSYPTGEEQPDAGSVDSGAVGSIDE